MHQMCRHRIPPYHPSPEPSQTVGDFVLLLLLAGRGAPGGSIQREATVQEMIFSSETKPIVTLVIVHFRLRVFAESFR